MYNVDATSLSRCGRGVQAGGKKQGCFFYVDLCNQSGGGAVVLEVRSLKGEGRREEGEVRSVKLEVSGEDKGSPVVFRLVAKYLFFFVASCTFIIPIPLPRMRKWVTNTVPDASPQFRHDSLLNFVEPLSIVYISFGL